MSDMARALMTHTGQKPQGLQFAQDTMQGIKNAPGNILKWAQQNPIDAGITGASMVPVVGDVIGLGKDVYDMSPMGDVPFTASNVGLAGAGLLPFVPAGMGAIKRVSLTPEMEGVARSSVENMPNFGRKTMVKALRSENLLPEGPLDKGIEDELFRLVGEINTARFDSKKAESLAKKDKFLNSAVEEFSPKIKKMGSGLWSDKYIKDISIDMAGGFDTGRSIVRANLDAVPRQLKKEGWTVRHVSEGKQGQKSSRYIASPDGKFEVRLSDHSLPNTGHRQDLEYRTRWDDEIILEGTEGPKEIIDNIKNLYKERAGYE